MKQITLNTYSFSELSDSAKEHAKYDHAAIFGYAWESEAMESIKALAAHFDGKMTNWDIDFFNSSYSSAKFDMPDDMTKSEVKARLLKLGSYNKRTNKGNGDCVLTGVCHDEDAIDGFRIAFFNGETDLNSLMQAAFKTWLKACHADCEDQYTDATFTDYSDSNELQYFENGKIA